MSDTTGAVAGQETYLRVGIDGSGAQTGARVVQRSLEDISNSADNTQRHLVEMKEVLYGIAGAAVGIYGLVTAIQALGNYAKESLNYLGLIETSTLGIASSFLVSGSYIDQITGKVLQGQTALKVAQNESLQVIDQLRFANLKTIATLDELIVAYQTTLPVAMSRGFDKQKVMDFTLAMVQAAGAIGLPFNQMAEETRSLLLGTINPRNSRIATVLGLRNEDIAEYKGNAEGLFTFLMGRLEGFRVAGEASMNTWKGLWSNFKDMSQQVSGKMFEGMFDVIKFELKEITASMFTIDEKNKTMKMSPEWESQMKSIGQTIQIIVHDIVQFSKFIWEHADAIKFVVEAYVGYKVIMSASTIMQNMMTVETEKNTAANATQRASVVSVYEAESVRLTQLRLAMETEKEKAVVTAAAAKEELARAQFLKVGLLAEQEIHGARVQALSDDVAQMEANAALAATEVQRTAYKVAAKQAELELNAARQASVATQLANAQELAVVQSSEAARAVELAQIKRNETIVELELIATEKERLMNSVGNSSKLNALSMEEAAWKNQLKIETQQLAVAEAEYETVRQSNLGNIKSVSQVEQLALKKEEANLKRSLTMLSKSEQAAIQSLTVAETELTGITKLHNAAMNESAILGKQLAASQTQLVAAEIAATAATAAETAAIEASTIATNSASIASRGLAAAKGGLASIIGGLGGPLGAVTTALMLGATAWSIWGNNAKDALDPGMEHSIERLTEKIKQHNKELENKKTTETGTRGGMASSHDVIGASVEEAQAIRDSELALAGMQMQLRQMGGPIKETRDSFKDTGKAISVHATDAKDNVRGLEIQIRDTTNKILDMKKAIEQRNSTATKYVANDPKPEDDSKTQKEIDRINNYNATQNKEYRDEQRKLDLADLEFKFSLVKSASTREITELRNKYNAYQMFQKDYEQMMYESQDKVAKAEVNKAKDTLNTIKGQVDASADAYASATTPESKNTARKEYNRLLVEETQAEAKLSEVISKRKDMEAQNTGRKKALDIQEDMNLAAIAANTLQLKGADLVAQSIKDEQTLLTIRNEKVREATKEYQLAVRMEALRKLDNAHYMNQASLVGKNKTGEFATTGEETKNALAVERNAQNQIQEAIQRKIAAEEKYLSVQYNGTEQQKNAIADIARYQKESDDSRIESAQKVAKIKNDADTASWADVLSHAKKAVPQLAALEGVLVAVKKDYTVKNMDGTKNEMKSNMAMTSAYVGAAGGAFQALADTQDQTSRKGFETAKAFNLAAAVMSTAAGIMNQYSSGDPYTANFRAAIVAAVGAIQIAQIASTSFGGGGTVSNISAGSFSGGGSSTGGSVGGSIGAKYASVHDSMSEQMLSDIATNTKDTSLALGKVADGLIKISDLFSSGSFMSLLGGSLATENTENNKTSAFKLWSSTFKPMTYLSSLENFGKSALEIPGMLATGGLFGGMFGGEKSIEGLGISLALKGSQASARGYQSVKTDGGWFSGDSHDTSYVNTPELTGTIQKVVDSLMSTIYKASAVMGTKVDKGLLGQVSLPEVKIDTRGKTADEINKELEKWLESASNELAKTVIGLKDFAFYGENAFDALVRLSTALQSSNEGLEKIGATLIASTLTGANAAYKLQEMMGGAEKFASKVDDYFTSMFTDQEQAAMKAKQEQRQVNTAFAEMNAAYGKIAITHWGRANTFVDASMSIPKTNAEFIKLVDSLDLTTERGASLFAALMDIAPAFADIQKQAEELAQAVADSNNDLQSRFLKATGMTDQADLFDLQIAQQKEMKDYIAKGYDVAKLAKVQQLEYAAAVKKVADTIAASVKTLNDATRSATLTNASNAASVLKSIITGSLSSKSPETLYHESQAAFAAALAKGDKANIPALGQALLTASRQANASGAGYQADYLTVTKALGEQAGITGDITIDKLTQQISLLESIKTNTNITSIDLQKMIAQQTASNVMDMVIGNKPKDMSFDINKDEVLDIKDALTYLKIAAGLPGFANGGITSGPSLAGEGSYNEAVIPLPDGRNVGVKMTGKADNDEELAELKEQNKLLREVIKKLTDIESPLRRVVQKAA